MSSGPSSAGVSPRGKVGLEYMGGRSDYGHQDREYGMKREEYGRSAHGRGSAADYYGSERRGSGGYGMGAGGGGPPTGGYHNGYQGQRAEYGSSMQGYNGGYNSASYNPNHSRSHQMAAAAGLHERNDFGQEIGKNGDLSQMSLQQAAAAAAAWQKTQGGPPGTKTSSVPGQSSTMPWGSGSASSGWGGSHTGGSNLNNTDRWGQASGAAAVAVGAGPAPGQWDRTAQAASSLSAAAAGPGAIGSVSAVNGTGAAPVVGGEVDRENLSWNPSTAYFQQQSGSVSGDGSTRGGRKQGWNGGNW